MVKCKLNIILDLDQTLIQSVITSQVPPAIMAYLKTKLDFTDINVYGAGMTVFARPGLQEFLDFVFENFNVGVLTHSIYEYASQVVNNLILVKPERKLVFLLDRSFIDEQQSSQYKGLKNLKYLFQLGIKGWHSCNTFIIDDNRQVYETNRGNCILVPKFVVASVNSFGAVLSRFQIYTFYPDVGIDDTVLKDLLLMLRRMLKYNGEHGCEKLCSDVDTPLFGRLVLKRFVDESFIQDWNRRIAVNSAF